MAHPAMTGDVRLARIRMMVRLAGAVAALGAAAAHADPLLVPSQHATIQQAVEAAAPGATIIVGAGAHGGFSFLGKDVTVRSASGAGETTITSTVFIVSGETEGASLEGFTVRMSGGPGPGLQIGHSSPRIENCRITGNHNTWGGGGVEIMGGAPVLLNTTIDGNTSGEEGLHQAGGGGLSAMESALTLINCTIENNTTTTGQANLHAQLRHDGGPGGGIYLRGGTALLVSCTIRNNSTGNGGSDAGCDSFNRNQPGTNGGSGGGIHLDGSDALLVNCIVNGNRTGQGGDGGECPPTAGGNGGSGGAIHAEGGGRLQVINGTISDNSAGSAGAGPAGAGSGGLVGGISAREISVQVRNTIVWGNLAPGSAEHEAQLALPVGAECTSSCIMGLPAGFDASGNFGLDPHFAQAGTDFRLLPNSPCIDAAENAHIPPGITTDAWGQPRFHNDPESVSVGRGGEEAVADVGAHEFQGISCYANCDGSTTEPVLNVDDFTCFIQRYTAGDPRANCDGSTAEPMLNIEDYTCFIARFAAGCP